MCCLVNALVVKLAVRGECWSGSAGIMSKLLLYMRVSDALCILICMYVYGDKSRYHLSLSLSIYIYVYACILLHKYTPAHHVWCERVHVCRCMWCARAWAPGLPTLRACAHWPPATSHARTRGAAARGAPPTLPTPEKLTSAGIDHQWPPFQMKAGVFPYCGTPARDQGLSRGQATAEAAATVGATVAVSHPAASWRSGNRGIGGSQLCPIPAIRIPPARREEGRSVGRVSEGAAHLGSYRGLVQHRRRLQCPGLLLKWWTPRMGGFSFGFALRQHQESEPSKPKNDPPPAPPPHIDLGRVVRHRIDSKPLLWQFKQQMPQALPMKALHFLSCIRSHKVQVSHTATRDIIISRETFFG